MLAVIAATAVLGLGCIDAEPTRPAAYDTGLEFNGERAYAHVATQVSFGPRHVGSEGHAQTRRWLRSTLAAAGYVVTEVTFPVPLSGAEGHNVVAWAGRGPALMLGTHFDTRLLADNDPDPAKRDEPPLGANDGASGVAVLLELARVIDLERAGHTLCLAFFDAEDNGRIDGWDWVLGSSYLAAHPEAVPSCASPRAVVVVDMVGDAEQGIYRDVSGWRTLQDALFNTAAELGYGEWLINAPRYDILDDHRPFAERGIPATVLIDFEYSAWHTSFDTLERVAATSLARVGRTLEVWVESGAAFR